jgi:hypothetical protein
MTDRQEISTSDPAIHSVAIALARRCRMIIQTCLREEEWLDADREFYLIIRAGLEDTRNGDRAGGDRSNKGEFDDRQAVC